MSDSKTKQLAFNLERAREILSRAQDLPADSWIRREAELGYAKAREAVENPQTGTKLTWTLEVEGVGTFKTESTYEPGWIEKNRPGFNREDDVFYADFAKAAVDGWKAIETILREHAYDIYIGLHRNEDQVDHGGWEDH